MATTGKTWADSDSDSDVEDLPKAKPSAAAPHRVNNSAPAPSSHHQPQPHSSRDAPAAQHGGDRRHNDRDREGPPRQKNEINPNGPFTLFVGNLAYTVTERDLGEFFSVGHCRVKNVNIPTDRDTNKPRGFGHVEMEDIDSLKRGLEAQNTTFHGRKINVDVGSAPPPSRDAGRGGGKDRRRDDRDAHPRDVPRDDRRAERRDDRRDGPRDDRRDGPRDYRKDDRNVVDSTPITRGAQLPPPPSKAGEPTVVQPAAVPERRKIEIKPRTIPVEAVAAPVETASTYSSIFGGGKARVETVGEGKPEKAKVEPAAQAHVGIEAKVEEMRVSPPEAPMHVKEHSKKEEPRKAPAARGDKAKANAKPDETVSKDNEAHRESKEPREKAPRTDRDTRAPQSRTGGRTDITASTKLRSEKEKRSGETSSSGRVDRSARGAGRGRGEEAARPKPSKSAAVESADGWTDAGVPAPAGGAQVASVQGEVSNSSAGMGAKKVGANIFSHFDQSDSEEDA